MSCCCFCCWKEEKLWGDRVKDQVGLVAWCAWVLHYWVRSKQKGSHIHSYPYHRQKWQLQFIDTNRSFNCTGIRHPRRSASLHPSVSKVAYESLTENPSQWIHQRRQYAVTPIHTLFQSLSLFLFTRRQLEAKYVACEGETSRHTWQEGSAWWSFIFSLSLSLFSFFLSFSPVIAISTLLYIERANYCHFSWWKERKEQKKEHHDHPNDVTQRVGKFFLLLLLFSPVSVICIYLG